VRKTKFLYRVQSKLELGDPQGWAKGLDAAEGHPATSQLLMNQTPQNFLLNQKVRVGGYARVPI